MQTKTLVLGAVLTAMVILLQMMGAFIHFGPFSISLVLIPIVIGAATCGAGISTWLGFVFGVVVLASGDAAAFLMVHALGTVITVLLKGTLCGLISGLAYRGTLALTSKCKNQNLSRYIAVLVAAIACPLVNTGVFLLGCLVFFMETLAGWAQAANIANVGYYMIFVLVGANFLFEMASNIILSPLVVRLLNIKK